MPPKRNSIMGGNGIDSGAARKIESKIYRYQLLHELSTEHFTFRQFWLFVFTKGVLIAISGSLAFFGFTKPVGIMAVVVAFLEAMNESCMYGTRGAMHEGVAIDLATLRSRLKLMRTKLEHDKQKNFGGAEAGGDPAELEDSSDQKDTFQAIRNQFEQSLSGCKSIVPIHLSGPFENLAARIGCKMDQANYENMCKKFGKKVNAKKPALVLGAYSILAAQIKKYPLFPLFLPHNEQSLVDKTIELWFEQITETQTVENETA